MAMVGWVLAILSVLWTAFLLIVSPVVMARLINSI
jgi:hypothetical protein